MDPRLIVPPADVRRRLALADYEYACVDRCERCGVTTRCYQHVQGGPLYCSGCALEREAMHPQGGHGASTS